MTFVANLRTLLIGLWLGAALFFSFALAPSVFSVISSRDLAGSVVNRTLGIINWGGLVIGLILLAGSFIFSRKIDAITLWTERALLVILATACTLGQFVIGARLHEIREQLGRPIDEIPESDPLRIAFNDLHGYSVMVLSVAMISAIIIFFLLARRANNGENQ